MMDYGAMNLVRTLVSETIQYSPDYKEFEIHTIDVQHNVNARVIVVDIFVSTAISPLLRGSFIYDPMNGLPDGRIDKLLDKAFEEIRFHSTLEEMLSKPEEI